MILDKFRLDGKIAVVTGGTKGIGKAIALAFAEAGADIAVVSRSPHPDIEKVILDLQPKYWIHGHTHIPCQYDLGDTRVVCNPRGYPRENPGPYAPVVLQV